MTDFSAGFDGSLWALDCDIDITGNAGVLVWDAFTLAWTKLAGARGVKISAYGHVGAAVLDKVGRIYVTSNEKGYLTMSKLPKPIDPASRLIMTDSTTLNETTKNFVYNTFKNFHKNATLCYRASTHGWASSTFHTNCNNKGATLTVIKTTTGHIFGGYTSVSWRNANGY